MVFLRTQVSMAVLARLVQLVHTSGGGVMVLLATSRSICKPLCVEARQELRLLYRLYMQSHFHNVQVCDGRRCSAECL